jgi:hypothetical protein
VREALPDLLREFVFALGKFASPKEFFASDRLKGSNAIHAPKQFY